MSRSLPVSDKLTARWDEERRQRLHRERLKKVKPSIDTAAPPRRAHVHTNRKKEQMREGEAPAPVPLRLPPALTSSHNVESLQNGTPKWRTRTG